MVFLKGEHIDEFLEIFWHPEFSIFRPLHDKTTLGVVKSRGGEIYDGEEIGIFFTDSGDEDSTREFEVLTRYCRGTCLEDVISGKSEAGELREVWMDERTSSQTETKCELARQHDNPLTATGLYRALNKARFDHEQLPDASRRLFYFSDISPACIWALSATVSSHDAAGLRDAIYKYLEFQNVDCSSNNVGWPPEFPVGLSPALLHFEQISAPVGGTWQGEHKATEEVD